MTNRLLTAAGGHYIHSVPESTRVAVCGFEPSGGWRVAFLKEATCPHCRRKLGMPAETPSAIRERLYRA